MLAFFGIAERFFELGVCLPATTAVAYSAVNPVAVRKSQH